MSELYDQEQAAEPIIAPAQPTLAELLALMELANAAAQESLALLKSLTKELL